MYKGNGFVVCILVKHRKQTNLTDICLLNLAVSDLLFVTVLPFLAHYAAVGQRWVFGEFMCRFMSGCHHVGFFSSIFFMVAMTVERYVAIVHSGTVAQYRTMWVGLTLSVLLWLLSVIPVDGSDGQVCDYGPESPTWKEYDVFTMSVLGVMIPLLLMLGCYPRIICVLVNTRNKKKHCCTVKLIICIVAVFFFFWAPYNITVFLEFLATVGILPYDCRLYEYLLLSVALTETIAYSHCCLNPIIYAFVGQRFKKQVRQMLHKWLSCIPLPFNRDVSEFSFRRSSVTSQSSDDNSIVM
ncbi:hypothetical protein INR49_012794 [Caranx melampygus]|nr:hypothetical protein INR49_012794 [Caranx melampygus]